MRYVAGKLKRITQKSALMKVAPFHILACHCFRRSFLLTKMDDAHTHKQAPNRRAFVRTNYSQGGIDVDGMCSSIKALLHIEFIVEHAHRHYSGWHLITSKMGKLLGNCFFSSFSSGFSLSCLSMSVVLLHFSLVEAPYTRTKPPPPSNKSKFKEMFVIQ